MWQETFRFSEAAEMLGVPFRFLKGWFERELIETVGTDDSRPGHPHLITFTEVIRLAVAVQVQRLSTVGPDAKWNPGSFLKPFRKMFPDEKLQHLPSGPTGGPLKVGWSDDEKFLKKMDEEATLRPDDLLLIIRNVRDEPTGKAKIFTELTLERFRRRVSVFLVADTAWILVNVSNVVRRLLASREAIRRRQEGGSSM